MATSSSDHDQPGPRVAAYMRVVANGVAKNGRAKATLIVTPRSPTDGATTDLNLPTWPGDIVKHLAGLANANKFPLSVSSTDPIKGTPSLAPNTRPSFIALADEQDGLNAVNDLWQKAINGVGANLWQTLLDDTDSSVTGKKSSADLQSSYPADTNNAPLLPNGALLADPHNPAKKTVVKGVVPNPQTSYAVDTEAARAQRVARKLAIGPYLPGDEDVDENVKQPATVPDPKTFANDRKTALLQRLKDSVDGTNPDRQRSHDDFNTVKSALGGPTAGAVPAPAAAAAAPAPVAPAAAPPAAAVLPIAPAAQVLGKKASGPSGGSASRAGHVYGSWAQWSPQHQEASAAAAKASAPTPKASTPDPKGTLFSIYYSLQGDPILSRLFGFAFDIEFDIPNAESGGYIWLAAGDASNPIWTKACYVASPDKTKRFWPAPRFEDVNASLALSREQMHGVFDLGQGYNQPKPQPRYSLTSLAVRGAVSQSLDVTGIDAIDKGERHQTIGWTLLDKGRAAQTARDLAVAEHQRDSLNHGNPVVLCAEDLTIGRRLDVKAVGPKQRNVQWRSLMNRFVEFTSLTSSAAKKRLDAIVADRLQKGKILDEAAFQLVARSMPIAGDGGSDTESNVEAVVEEAFQSWDGTPLAALACKPSANGSGSKVLPVKRAYDLPDSNFPDLRPPPLRYGIGYIFSIRSEFAGGGSPSVDEAASWHAAQDGKMTLPPSDKDKVAKPRRFLRHESIGAPILMLPDHLVKGTNGAMGFEPPARAVVRTATAPDKPFPGEINTSAPGPDYIEPAQRAHPDTTMRVFVAPIAGMDFCARHGVFDDPGTARQRLGGGLLDVEFYTDPKKLGFPVAVVKENTGFNADRLIYRRESGRPGVKPSDSEGLGATIFHPQAPAKREGGRAYLPDPAAETMSLRLRVTGSDKYLKGDVCVELYPSAMDKDYPHTLPVVVTVEKTNKQRAKPAASVTDVLQGKPKEIVRLREGGVIGPDSGAGVRVRHLRVVVAPGEQFDLEATCLPSEAKLAEWFSLPEAMGVQHLLAASSHAAANALCLSCGQASVATMTALVANTKPAAFTGLGGYAPPDENSLGTVSKQLLDCISNNWQLSEVAGTTTLHVEHAVSAPQDAVSLDKIVIVRPDPSTPPPVPPALLSAPPTASAPGSPTLLLTGELLVDLEQVAAVDIVAEVVNPGAKAFDDPARGRSMLAKRGGRWPTIPSGEGKRQYSRKRAVLGFDVDPAGKTTLLREMVTLLRIQNLPDPRAAVNNPLLPPIFLDPDPTQVRRARIDLGVLDWAVRNGVPVEIPVASNGHPEKPATRTIGVTRAHEISDTRARFVKLYAVAVSRLARSFETAPMFSADGKEHLLRRRQPLHDRDQRKTGPAVEAWSQATARPAPVAARTPTPFFAIKRFAKKDGGTVTQNLVRKCGVRLRFDRGMFSAGEGERIGIVLWPPGILEQNPIYLEDNTVDFVGRTMTLDDFVDADLGDGGQYISRWGGDPIRSDPTPQTGWFMPPTAFACLNPAEAGEPQAHDPMYIPSVSMPISTKPAGSADGTSDDNATLTFMQVALLTFEPYFDIDAEEWFVDVAMDAARATDPFIRLGLVRYQPKAITDDLPNAIKDHLMVSTPVRVWTQLPPRRTLSLDHRPTHSGDVVLKAIVRGQASDGIKPLPDDAVQSLLNDPNDEKAAAARRAVWDRLQRPKMVLKVVHETEEEDFGRRQTNVFPTETTDFGDGIIENGEMTWSISLTMPKSRMSDLGPGQFVAVVEEIEERLPATYPSEPIKLTDLLNADVVRQSGPRFIARVPFYERHQ
jgi:hypothetical protein